MLCGDRDRLVLVGVVSVGRGRDEAGSGEEFQARVEAAFGPFVGLLGEDGADEADDRCSVGEDPDDVGAAAHLLVQPFLRVDAPTGCQGEFGGGVV